MPPLTDIVEVKKVLDIPIGDKSEDTKLNFFIEWASAWILELLNRPEFFYGVRTEYYDGTGTQKLLLRSRPVYTTPEILVATDLSGFYGAVSGSFSQVGDTLVYGRDFCLKIDQTDGSSRSGILVRMNNFWNKPQVRQGGWLSPFIGQAFGNVKVTYGAGYTLENMPTQLRAACCALVAKMSYFWPTAMEMSSENYEDRSVSFLLENKNYLLTTVRSMVFSLRNWKF